MLACWVSVKPVMKVALAVWMTSGAAMSVCSIPAESAKAGTSSVRSRAGSTEKRRKLSALATYVP